jgi:hypothetical protein
MTFLSDRMCPPYRDPTTSSSQYWQLLAPRIRKCIRFSVIPNTPDEPYGLNSGIKNILFNPSRTLGAWVKLAKPTVWASRSHQASTATTTELYQSVIAHGNTLASIEALPTELIAIILDDEVMSKEDVLSFGLSSSALWPHTLRHIEEDYRQHAAVLAGVEIAFTGTHLMGLPDSFKADDLALDTSSFAHKNMCSARKYNWTALKEFKNFDMDVGTAWRSAWHTVGSSKKRNQSSLQPQLHAEFMDVVASRYDGLHILRNLTTKEYVRCRPGPAPVMDGYVDHPYAKGLRIDDVLWMRIGWGRNRSTTLDFNELFLGKWAGHCFDIVPFESGLVIDGGWKDSTEEVVQQALDIAARVKGGSEDDDGKRKSLEQLSYDFATMSWDEVCE